MPLSRSLSQVLYNVFDAFVSLGGPKINAEEIIKGIGMDTDIQNHLITSENTFS